MEKIKGIIKSKISQIVITAFLGVLSIASSYTPAVSASGRLSTYRSARAAEIDPFLLALGVALLVASFLIYRKWSSELDRDR